MKSFTSESKLELVRDLIRFYFPCYIADIGEFSICLKYEIEEANRLVDHLFIYLMGNNILCLDGFWRHQLLRCLLKHNTIQWYNNEKIEDCTRPYPEGKEAENLLLDLYKLLKNKEGESYVRTKLKLNNIIG